MAIDESDEACNHVVRVLLDAAISSPINLLLRADNCTSIARLRQLIKIPGLHERAELFRLNGEQYEDLQAIGSYINWAHNAGHSDITTRTRGSFDHFFENVYDAHAVAAPVIEHTVSLIQALKSPKITTQMARQLHHTDVRRILSERDVRPHMTNARKGGEGTNAQPEAHDNTRHVNMTVSSPFRPELPRNHA